jgi:hypothetical protein
MDESSSYHPTVFSKIQFNYYYPKVSPLNFPTKMLLQILHFIATVQTAQYEAKLSSMSCVQVGQYTVV